MILQRRYVSVGTGHRARRYLDAISGPHRNESLRTGTPVKIADLGLGVDVTRL